MQSTYQHRCARLVRKLRKTEAAGMLVTQPHNVRYLSGFTGDSTYLLLSDKTRMLISDTRYQTQIAGECPDFQLEIRDASTTTEELAGRVIAQLGIRSLAVEADSLTKSSYDRIAEKLSSARLLDTIGLVQELRAIKDKGEIAAIRRSIQVAERAIGVTLARLTGGQTELEIAHELEHEIRRLGGSGCSFEPMVGVGANAALPHGRPTSATISQAPFVLIDWGARVSGYASDLTRVYLTGKIPAKFERVYRVVHQAQAAAIRLIRPGAALKAVDAAARSVIAEAGFGKYFGHGLGHGFGLEIHELPRLSPAADGLLCAGMVVTVEPGIYLPGFGGVRLEDDVLVTEDGCQVLSSLPSEFERVRVDCW
jgi:Xaa-Pro aminopeptidase